MAPSRTFQPTITGSSWNTVWLATIEAAKRRRGLDSTSEARLSNGDVAQLVAAWTQQSGTGGFALWYQFAAAAFGWNARKRDVLDATAGQRDALIDPVLSRELWIATEGLARELDASGISARLTFDESFDDPVFQGSVKAALLGDGAKAQFKIPVGCKDPKTGRATGPRMKCKDGWILEPVEGTRGLLYVCRNPKTGETERPTYACEGETIVVDDPITGAGNQMMRELVQIALVIGGVWLASKVISSFVDRGVKSI
jgi:hypothetical protein